MAATGEARGALPRPTRGLLSADGVFAATVDGAGGPAVLQGGLPDQPADPRAVQGRAADPEGAGAGAESDVQRWAEPARTRCRAAELAAQRAPPDAGRPAVGSPDPIVYKIDLLVPTHSFTTSKVLPIDPFGGRTVSFDATGRTYAAGTERTLPPSTIYGFNGTFPGPTDQRRVRQAGPGPLREPPATRTRSASTARTSARPDFSFLTHLHNGHTAPESDGNPHYSMPPARRRGLPARGCGSTTST